MWFNGVNLCLAVCCEISQSGAGATPRGLSLTVPERRREMLPCDAYLSAGKEYLWLGFTFGYSGHYKKVIPDSTLGVGPIIDTRCTFLVPLTNGQHSEARACWACECCTPFRLQWFCCAIPSSKRVRKVSVRSKPGSSQSVRLYNLQQWTQHSRNHQLHTVQAGKIYHHALQLSFIFDTHNPRLPSRLLWWRPGRPGKGTGDCRCEGIRCRRRSQRVI
jgi:hypothetical protein